MIEIIATNPEEAMIIEKCGADRIELISAFSEGGLTPSYGIIKKTIEVTKIPVNVMIRPHSKSFVYTQNEIGAMKTDIEIARKLGANGVVFGVLDDNNHIHEKQLQELLTVCAGLDITFHRAIDNLNDLPKGIKILSQYPQITSVLTSGGRGNILENISTIKKMISLAGDITIMVGGGLTFDNISTIIRNTNSKAYHFGTAVRLNNSHFGSIDENKLRQLIKIIKNSHQDGYSEA